MRLALTLFLVLFSFQAADAEFMPWMEEAFKQGNPNELAYRVSVASDCPMTKAEAVSNLEGVFIRSRIKPVREDWFAESVYLFAGLDCLLIKNQNPVFVISVQFGDYSGVIPVLYDATYGSLGMGPKEFMRTGFQEHIEHAITAYLRANFDLGD